MNTVEMWKVLGIEPTKDENEIINAYRAKVVTVNPEDDAEGFMALREAFEMALNFAKEDDVLDDGQHEKPDSEKTDIDRHIDKFADIYKDVLTRKDLTLWEEWFADPLCTELDSSDVLREAMLAYMMDHFMLPNEVWKMIGETFNVEEDRQVLLEKFPEDYINYVIFRIQTSDFVEYEFFESRDDYNKRREGIIPEIKITGDTSALAEERYDVHNDVYIRILSLLQSNIINIFSFELDEKEDDRTPEQKAEEKQKQVDFLCGSLEFLSAFDIWHPIEVGAKIRALEFTDRIDEMKQLASAVIFDNLVPENLYTRAEAIYSLLRIVKEFSDHVTEEEKAKILEVAPGVIDNLYEKDPERAMTLMAKGYLQLVEGDFEKASDTIINILDQNQKHSEAVWLLKFISKAATDSYEEKLAAGTATVKEKVELAWSYFRIEDVDNVFRVLDQTEPDEENFYAYNNLYGRSYATKEQYDKAEPYIKKWVEMLDELRAKDAAGEELSKKDKERIDRTAFCYYMYALTEEKMGRIEIAEEYYNKAIDISQETTRDMNEHLFYLESFGKLLNEKRRFPEAMEIWNRMIKTIDHCVPAYIHRQETAHEMRDAQLVIDDYYNIIRDYPQYPKAYVYAARVFLIYNQYEDVEGVFKRAEEAEIKSDMLEAIRAHMFEKQDKRDEAEALYLQLIKNVEAGESDIEEVAELYADMASFYINFRDENGARTKLKETAEYLAKGLEVDPKYKRLLWIKTDLEEFSGRQADEVYKEMLETFPEDPQVFYEYGEYLKRDGRPGLAIGQYEKTLELDDGHRAANNKLMGLYLDKYLDTENREYYNKASEHAARQLELIDDDYYRIERALMFLDGYEIDKAEEDARKAIEFKDTNVYAHNALGLCFIKRREYEEALKCFAKAIEVMEGDETPVPFMNSAKCYEALGDYNKALEFVTKSVERFGPTANNKYVAARLSVKAGKFEQASKCYEELVKYYTTQLEKTGNKWNISKIVRYMIKQIDVAILSGNDQSVQLKSSQLSTFLKEKGYLNKGLDEITLGVERRVASNVFRQLADFYLNNERQYKLAIKYFEKCIRFMMPGGSQGPQTSIVDDAERLSPVKKVLKKMGPEAYIERPEDVKGADLYDIAEMYRFFAGACYAYGLKNWANEIAKRALECYKKKYGSIENYLSYPSAEALRRSDVAMIYFYAGMEKEARELLDTVDKCAPCDFCNCGVCYDKFLTLARIEELSGNFPDAIDNFRKSRDMSPDDAEIYTALRSLSGKSKI